MSFTPEALYLQLGALVAEMPDLAHGPITPEINRWLGRAAALVDASGDMANTLIIKSAAQNLSGILRDTNAQTITAAVYQALAKAELAAPAQVKGTFIPAGHTLDAYAAVAKVLATATADVLLVDPYADAVVLTDYAVLAPDNVTIRLLAKDDRKALLKPAAERWLQQLKGARPLEVRLAPAKTLHDRLIVVDRKAVWDLGQSFNKLAARAHTSLTRSSSDITEEKIAAYEALWRSALPL